MFEGFIIRAESHKEMVFCVIVRFLLKIMKEFVAVVPRIYLAFFRFLAL